MKYYYLFLYCSISEHQKDQSERGITICGGGILLNYSFFIFIDFFNPCRNAYKNLMCLHKKGHSRDFDFSNTLENLRVRLNNSFYYRLYGIINYNVAVNKPLKFSITFKDTELLENINYYVNHVMEIDVIRPCLRNTVNKINTEKTFKSNECLIGLSNKNKG